MTPRPRILGALGVIGRPVKSDLYAVTDFPVLTCG